VDSGTVVRFNPGKHYGFIKPDSGGADVMLHDRELAAGEDPARLLEGVRVTYDPRRSERGMRAAHVRIRPPEVSFQPPAAGFLEEVSAVMDRAAIEVEDIARRYGMAG
jgi:cold shock CspA family protein